jgi:NADH-quinone oxidoreductase subunit L
MFSLVILPLFCSVLCGLFLRNADKLYSNIITSLGVFVALLVSVYAFYLTSFKAEVIDVNLLHFFTIGEFKSYWSIYIDSLTAIMLAVVCFVSLLVHIYSIGYMSHDENPQKFMSFLSLFTFFMIVLITAKDFIQLFVGWEGVGLSSYLLIGFWYYKESANKASIKAFITNRVGDLALIIGMCGIFYLFKSLNFADIKQNLHLLTQNTVIFGYEVSIATFIAVLLFIGCMGKSAQILLHVWLPDAMEGPTPVSALIHAATMVTAGVFLMSRVSFIFEYSDFARQMVIIVGTITAFFAGTIALTQNDIKKIIAYSTCSQLGYMFVASGFSAYNAGVFHLVTHAFFKALLFLSAGSVIHAMSGEQDIKKMGGLGVKIPLTFTCMMIGSVAIAGIPPLAGYFSKDAILESAFMSSNPLGLTSFIILVITACLTTFYSWRLIVLVFHGSIKNTQDVIDHIHESPKVMTVPLILLSVFAVLSGFILERYFHILSPSEGIFKKSIYILAQNDVLEKIHHTPALIKNLPTLLSLLMIMFAYWYFSKQRFNPVPNFIKNIVSNKYYIDEIYNIIFIKPTYKISEFFVKTFDKKIVDGAIVLIPIKISIGVSHLSAKIQNGKIIQYIVFSFLTILATFYFIIKQF